MFCKQILYLIIFIIYSNSSSSQNCPLADEYFRFSNGWQIRDASFFQDSTKIIQKEYNRGHGIIFRYKAIYDCPDSFDEEGIDVLTWHIPDSVTNFKLDFLDSLRQYENLYYYFIQWGIIPKTFNLITINGSISGTKENNSWKVFGKLKIVAGNSTKQFSRNIDFSKPFTVSKGKKDKRKPAEPFLWEGKRFY